MSTTLPYLTDDAAGPDLRAQFDEIEKIMGNVPPLLRILANTPSFVPAFMSFAGPVLGGEHLTIDLKCLAILRVSEINNCNYCRGYYAPLAEQVGLVGEKREAINNGSLANDLFSPAEVAVLELADEMTKQVQASSACVDRAKAVLGVGGALEAMMVIGLFNLINRVARSSGLPLES